MQSETAITTWNEADRLFALQQYHILDTPPEQAFDDVVRLTAQALRTPMAAVNFLAKDRQWFKAEVGMGVRETPLNDAICKTTILQQQQMIVPDTESDPRFACNPFVVGDPKVRFYAAQILLTPDGFPLGTLCALDTKPRPEGLTPLQQSTLKTLAQQVQTELELRKLGHRHQCLLAENEKIHNTLQLEQERNRIATDAAQLGHWSWDPIADHVIWENQRLYELFGLPLDAEPVNGKRFVRDFVHPDDAPAFELATATAIAGGRFYFQGRVRRADRQLCWLEFFGKAQYSESGKLTRMIGVSIDITEKKQAEIELLQSRERFQTIVSQAATGVVEADSHGDIIFVNQKYCHLLGYTEEELLRKNLLDVTAPDSVQATRDVLQRLRTDGREAVLEKQYLRKDGAIIWGSASMNLLRGSVGDAPSTVSIIVDITENKYAQESLRKLAASLFESDRRKSEFLATLAHEMRNPLAPICSGLELMRLHSEDLPAIGKVREMLDRQVAHLVRLVDDLLDIARIGDGKIVLKKVSVSLKSLIVQAVETSQPVIDNGNHILTVKLPDESLLLDADPIRITQILANLLNNAAKYTPAGGKIALTTEVDHNNVVIQVSDNGVGIAKESLNTIFDMFNQVETSIDQAQGGLGIGLSLVKRLVEMHGGRVAAMSQGKDLGSTFAVSLPLLQPNAMLAPRPSSDPSIETNRGKHLRLLIADDNVDSAEALSMIFATSGHTTMVVNDGIQAVAAAQTFAPDIAFLDIGMPGMDGYEAATTIRKLQGFQNIVLVALTGWNQESDKLHAREAGFDHHITKPVDFEKAQTFLAEIASNRFIC